MRKMVAMIAVLFSPLLGRAISGGEFDAMMEVVPHIEFPVDDGVWFENLSAKAGELEFSPDDPNWRKTDRWRFITGRSYKLADPNAPTVTLYGEFEMPVAKKQAMLIRIDGTPGLSTVRVLHNGIEVKTEGLVYQLPLTQGKNSLTLQATLDFEAKAKKKKKKAVSGLSFFLRPVEMEYVDPTPSQKLLALRRAVEFLGQEHRDYPADKFLTEIRALLPKIGTKEFDAALKKLQLDALLYQNPVFDFDELLVRVGRAASFANWRGNSSQKKTGWKNQIAKLSLRDFSLDTIFRPEDNGSLFVGDLCLSFDADRFLFSSIRPENETWQVFEMNIDGTGMRQVTPDIGPDVDNYNGVYLPNGQIVFCSTANMTGVPCVRGKDYVGTLYTADSNGENMRQLTFEQDADWHPWVMDDGRVMYLRWEYTDNSHYFTRILMTMNPDGSRQRSIYGSGSYWPNTMFRARNIPGSSSRFSAIVSSHHGSGRTGELILFDAAKGEFETDGVVQRIPGYGQKVQNIIRDGYMNGQLIPKFIDAYPVSGDFFLACGSTAKQGGGLYLVDRFDNVVQLLGGPVQEAAPLKKRKTPRQSPSLIDTTAKDSVLTIQDIYEGPGLKNIPRGSVKALRIFTYSFGYRDLGGHDALAIEGGWDGKRLLGTVPVEPDGSVSVRVPHSTPLSLQPLDAAGRAMQLFRSWLVAMPGETLSCVGCHESARTPPLTRMGAAMKRAPNPVTPWRQERLHGFDFLREVQPVLDRRCVGCHDGSKPDRPNFQDTGGMAFTHKKLKQRYPNGAFSRSYVDLHPYVRRPGPESDFRTLDPMDYHASTSELFQMLDKGHYGVELTQAEQAKLYTWVDLNVPFYPTWSSVSREKTETIAARSRELRLKYAGIDDDPEWMPETPVARPAFGKPTGSVKPKTAAPKRNGWPMSANAGKQATINLGDDLKLKLRQIPAGSFVMGSNGGAEDERPMSVVNIEKPFWIAEAEITNEAFRQFDPTHNSRFIDQQWKDHVYEGYPANEPQMPVVRVSWKQAMAYCKWLSEETGLNVTLPTEAQWEWAARAGTDSDFYFGDDGFELYENLADAQIANLAVAGINPKPVSEHNRSFLNDFVPRDDSYDDGRLTPDGTAQYSANPFGLYDMLGNVAEWTRSDYLPYPYTEKTTPDARKSVRGGSWRSRPKYATASFRAAYQPWQKVYNVGFRIVVEPADNAPFARWEESAATAPSPKPIIRRRQPQPRKTMKDK